jgi:hypothetical protein
LIFFTSCIQTTGNKTILNVTVICDMFGCLHGGLKEEKITIGISHTIMLEAEPQQVQWPN